MSEKREWHSGLTEKQRRFCEAFASNGGNAMQSAKSAGYKQAHVIGHENLEKPRIKQALEALRLETTSEAIATRETRQTLWTRLMLDEKLDVNARLKASELLGRSQADFTDRHDHQHSGDFNFNMVLKTNETKGTK